MNNSNRNATTVFRKRGLGLALTTLVCMFAFNVSVHAADIIHDAEHIMIASQPAEGRLHIWDYPKTLLLPMNRDYRFLSAQHKLELTPCLLIFMPDI